jgi:uncharacterized SAM-binding protein YcdF (DUF218 family)
LVTLKMLLRTLVLPPAGLLLLAFAGAWLLARYPPGRARRAGLALLLAALGSLWLLATPLVADVLHRLAEREPVLDLTQVADAQAIVILGGAGARHAAPEYGRTPAAASELLERLAYGAYLAHRTQLPVLVSGEFSETEAMHTSLAREFGVPTRWIESHSRDTFENAEFSARLLREAGVTRILLVTSAAHAYRARQEFEAAGLSVRAAPVGMLASLQLTAPRFVPSAAALEHSTEALYELLGDLARRVFVALHLRRHSL